MSTEVTFWHSAEYGSDFRSNSGEIPRNSAEFRGISPELSRNHFRSQKIPRNSVSAEFREHPSNRLMLAEGRMGFKPIPCDPYAWVSFKHHILRDTSCFKNYLLTTDSYGPVYNRFHRGE